MKPSSLRGFNSTLVRLEVLRVLNWAILILCFNSTLVRLEVGRALHNAGFDSTFQFHTGSIRSKILKVTQDVLNAFQFHTGSIRSTSGRCYLKSGRPGFNSTLVRLEEALMIYTIGHSNHVSIPHWFD